MKFTLKQSYAVNCLILYIFSSLMLFTFLFLPGWEALYSLSFYWQLPSTLISPGHLQHESHILEYFTISVSLYQQSGPQLLC